MKKETIDLKEMAAASKETRKEENVFEKFRASKETHGFNKNITIKREKVRSLNSLLIKEKNANVILPLDSTSYVSLKYNISDIRDIIINSDVFNPDLEYTKDIITAFDAKLLEATNEEIKTGGNVVKGKLLKDIALNKAGECFIILNNEMIIGDVVPQSIISRLSINDQSRLIKSHIPKELRDVIITDNILLQDTPIKIGRLDGDLAIKVNPVKLFTHLLLPSLVAVPGYDDLPIIEKERIKGIYSKVILVGEKCIIKNNELFFALEILCGGYIKSGLELRVNRRNFTCANLSYTHEDYAHALKEVVSTAVAKRYFKTIEGANEADEAMYIDEIKKEMDVKINFVSIASVSSFKIQSSNRTLADCGMFSTVDSPLYIPVIEFIPTAFKNVGQGIFSTSMFGPLLNNKGNLNFNLLKKCFVDFVSEGNLVIGDSYYSNKIILIPDAKKMTLTSLVGAEAIYEFGISMRSDNKYVAFAVQI